MGWYDQIKQYDPGYYMEKYKYKPGKRIVSYALQKTVFKKTSTGYNKFGKTRSQRNNCGDIDKRGFFSSKSSYCSQ